uniref:Uncharacterized protein n=1 Tax=Octopus bimaculoides TaxID=37653 RepID=A0A0L8I227_OCTBM
MRYTTSTYPNIYCFLNGKCSSNGFPIFSIQHQSVFRVSSADFSAWPPFGSLFDAS